MMFAGLAALTLALLPLAVRAQDENVTVVFQALQTAGIVPAIIPNNPAVIRFPLETVFSTNNGTFAVNADVAEAPTFALQSNITAIIGKPYLMVIMDLDAPTPQNNTQAPFLHLLLADQAANSSTHGEFVLLNQSSSAPLAPYVAPSPAPSSDPHRYVILCYLQNQLGVAAPAGFNASDRNNFNITSFTASVKNNNFTLISASFFHVGANLTASVQPNATLPDGSLPNATATAPANTSGSGSPGNTSAAFGDDHTLLKAMMWSAVGVLTATGALLL